MDRLLIHKAKGKGKFKCSNDITFRYGTVEVEIERP